MKAFEFLPLNEMSRDQVEKMSRIQRRMEGDPALVDELFKTLSLRVKDEEGTINDRITMMLDPKNTGVEQDQIWQQSFLTSLATVIDQTEGTTEEKLEFANTFGKVKHIDAKKLITPGASKWDDWLVGTDFSKRLFHACFNHPAFLVSNKGPGEAALSFLTTEISLNTAKGDISVNGHGVEVKGGEKASGGRLTPSKGVLGNLFNNEPFWRQMFPDDEDKIQELITTTGVYYTNYGEFLANHNMSPENSKEILSAIFKSDVGNLINVAAKKGTNVQPIDIVKIAFMNYGVSQGDDMFLIIQRNNETSLFFEVDNIEPIWNQLAVSLSLIDRDYRSAGKAQIGIRSRLRK
jgi:hypothetical protein